MVEKAKNLSKSLLKDLYVKQKKTMIEIGKITKHGCGTICRYLHKFNIPVRKRTGKSPKKPIKITGELLEIFNGHMLGDGNLEKKVTKRQNTSFRLDSKYLNYIKENRKKFKILNPKISKRIIGKRTYFNLRTKSKISPSLYKKWYPNGKKMIPYDIRLTPLTCLYWYLDDGGLRKSYIRFCTNGFKEQNIKRIILPQLEQILNCKKSEIKIYKFKSNNYTPEIYIPRKFGKIFLNYIGKCPIKEFEYKWNLKPYKQKGRKYYG